MTFRNVLFQLHLWTGLTLGLLFALLGLSGSALVYHDDMLAFAQAPAPKATAIGVALPLDVLLAAAREKTSYAGLSTTLTLPQAKGEPAAFRFQNAATRKATDVYVDPASAVVLGAHPSANDSVFRLMHDLHGRFFVPGREGRQLVGWLGVAMLLLGLSGSILWWPRRDQWTGAFTVRRNARGYWLHRDLHGAAGIWGLIVFVIVSFTGVAIAFPVSTRSLVSFGQADPAPTPSFNARTGPAVTPIKGANPIGLDQAAALVKAHLPNADITTIAIPAKPDAAWRITLGTQKNGPVTVAFVDPWRNKIAAIRDGGANSADRFMAWQRPLHVGDGWGGLWRFLVFLSGLLPALFLFTGAAMWLKKRKARVRVLPSAARESVDA
ncbi:MAG TPA: PepSY-associated TM helix domain-containing protein [Rhizomicrobium sp.]|nr:PepSY-associated TM helix domain-containing protein [Rhizomicrobium sp.]